MNEVFLPTRAPAGCMCYSSREPATVMQERARARSSEGTLQVSHTFATLACDLAADPQLCAERRATSDTATRMQMQTIQLFTVLGK